MRCSSGSDPERGAPIAGLRLAPLREEHLEQVLAIESISFLSPWKREHFVHEIRDNPWAHNLAVVDSDTVVAYAATWRLEGELKINNIAVREDYRRRGVGRWLLREILAGARRAGCRLATLEVRPSNESALRLYASFGFEEVGRRPGYYSREGEDALLLTARLDPGALPALERYHLMTSLVVPRPIGWVSTWGPSQNSTA